jgi:hypothetical protein
MDCREQVSVAEFTTSERTAFVNAILALKVAPSKITLAANAATAGGGVANRYDDYVWMHNTVGASAHFGSAFGPWHREFLRQFEFDLRQVSGNPHIVIPYWDWTTGRVAGDAGWPFTPDLLGGLGDAFGSVVDGPFSNPATWRMNIRRTVFNQAGTAQVPDTNVGLRRRPASVAAGFNLPTAANARQGMAVTTPYDAVPFNEASLLATATNAQINTWVSQSFRKFLEWALHNGVHTWIGGQDVWPSGATPTSIGGPMAFPPVAVNDPTFWLHHCNIDRLWTTWQQRHPPGAYVPVSGGNLGHNLNDEMLHFAAADASGFNTPLLGHPADLLDSRGIDIWYRSDLPRITLVTPSVDFGDVPANLTTDWPVKFDVRTCRRVKFRVTAIGGTNFHIPPTQGDVLAEHSDTHDPVRANVFVEFQALGTSNVLQSGTVTIGAFIDDGEGYFTGTVGAEFQVGTFTAIGLSATPVPAPRAAVALVLDRSGSMADSAGPAGSKVDLLRSSLQVVAAIMRDDDAIGLVSYDDVTATLTSPSIVPMGSISPPGAGRQAVETARTSLDLNPRGATAIGQAMIDGAAALQTVQSDTNYATKAMVVMTDGNENRGPSVATQVVHDAVAWFSDNVYAIGLGDETNVSATTLGAIARYQLITGNITTSEQQFLLTKYFLQILAQIANNAIVVDPQGELRPGDEHRIPFFIADSDVTLEAIALCPLPWYLDFTLEAPDGTLIQPGVSPNVAYQLDAKDALYRVGLPAIPGNASGTHGGLWTAVLRIGDPAKIAGFARKEAFDRRETSIDQAALAAVARRGALPYQIVVQSYSNLSMKVELQQDGLRPGAVLTLLAGLTEYLVPIDHRARVIVEVTEPDGSEVQVRLDEVAPGRFQGTHATVLQGIYRCRFRADGFTRSGKRFQREDMRTAAVSAKFGTGTVGYPGSDPGRGDPEGERWCALMACLLREPSIEQFLKKREIDPGEIEKCLRRYCSAAVARYDQPRTDRKDATMSDETERLRREIELLRRDLKASAPLASRQLDQLLMAAPPAVPQEPAPKAASMQELSAMTDEHRHPLPFVLVDDDGKHMRVVRPASENLLGGSEGRPAGGAADDPSTGPETPKGRPRDRK